MIATDDSEVKEMKDVNGESNTKQKKSRKHVKQKLDSEFGVVRGLDFKNVYTVCQCYAILSFLEPSNILIFCRIINDRESEDMISLPQVLESFTPRPSIPDKRILVV